MGLQDRDYMRRRSQEPRALDDLDARAEDGPPINWRTRLFVVGCVLAVAGAAFWLLRDVRAPIPASAPTLESRSVNINTATQQQLESVAGVGPVLASRIIEGRPYRSVDELVRVAGIGERTLETMRPFLTTADD